MGKELWEHTPHDLGVKFPSFGDYHFLDVELGIKSTNYYGS